MFVKTRIPAERVVRLPNQPSSGEVIMFRFLGFYDEKAGELILDRSTIVSFLKNGNLMVHTNYQQMVSVQLIKGRWKFFRRR